jgi:hypothetical protein
MCVISDDIIRELIDKGLVPDLPLRRVVIDFKHEEAVVIYYECFGERKTQDTSGIEKENATQDTSGIEKENATQDTSGIEKENATQEGVGK